MHLTLHGPDGSDYPNEYRLFRIEPERLIEIEHLSHDHHFMLALELHPQGESTLVKWTQTFDTVDHFQQVANFVATANDQVLERLSAEVHRGSSPA